VPASVPEAGRRFARRSTLPIPKVLLPYLNATGATRPTPRAHALLVMTLRLDDIRSDLIRQEETIIFALIERAQFRLNDRIYVSGTGGIAVPGFDGCFSDFMLYETECVHARVRRYTSPEEHPFFEELPQPVLPAFDGPGVLAPNTVNVNAQIKQLYRTRMLPAICAAGDDDNYGSSATCDVACLQALSKRIHYGKFVAESKYIEEPMVYDRLIADGDAAGIEEKLTRKDVEARLLKRVERKAAAYGQDIEEAAGTAAPTHYKFQPATVAEIYRTWVIPLTIKVEVDYLFQRCAGS
jgi:chorismate mutase